MGDDPVEGHTEKNAVENPESFGGLDVILLVSRRIQSLSKILLHLYLTLMIQKEKYMFLQMLVMYLKTFEWH